MTEREAFIAQLANQPLRKGGVLVLLQGDGYSRVPYAAQLYADGFAPVIVIVGGDTRREYGSYPSSELRTRLVDAGVPADAIVFEETAEHTRAEAERVVTLAKEHGWKNLIIITSPHHMYRAYLTFLKAMHDASTELTLQPAPVRDLPWYVSMPWGKRSELLPPELERIEVYGAKGDVASYSEGLACLEANEANV
jgi:uncharacterized SAM-binding protein YcdF (DUF218 family)